MPALETAQNGLAVRNVNRIASPLQSPVPHGNPIHSANIGKRRALASSVMCSPARPGHQSGMAEMFSRARAHLDSISDASTSPRWSYLSTLPSTVDNYDVQYPALPLIPTPPRRLEHPVASNGIRVNHAQVFPVPSTTHDGAIETPQRGRRLVRDAETHRTPPPRFHPQRPIRRDAPYSAETLKPERYYARLGRPAEAPQSDTAKSEVSSKSGGSSTSWTGDSDFYYSKPQPLPQQQRQCSVSEWLEQLPDKLEKLGHGIEGEDGEGEGEDEDQSEPPMSPLSPNVELERGTIRRRRIERKVRKRCPSYNDEDIFGIET